MNKHNNNNRQKDKTCHVLLLWNITAYRLWLSCAKASEIGTNSINGVTHLSINSFLLPEIRTFLSRNSCLKWTRVPLLYILEAEVEKQAEGSRVPIVYQYRLSPVSATRNSAPKSVIRLRATYREPRISRAPLYVACCLETVQLYAWQQLFRCRSL